MSCRPSAMQPTRPVLSNVRWRGLAISTLLLGTAFGAPGTAAAADSGIEFSGIVIGTFQGTPEDKIAGEQVKQEPSGSVSLSLTAPTAGGAFEMEVRGGTTPRNKGVSSILPEVNGAVGESLDDNGKGRIVIWQLFYHHDLGPGSLALGLMDVTAGWLAGC